jgi:hypothetical protein
MLKVDNFYHRHIQPYRLVYYKISTPQFWHAIRLHWPHLIECILKSCNNIIRCFTKHIDLWKNKKMEKL